MKTTWTLLAASLLFGSYMAGAEQLPTSEPTSAPSEAGADNSGSEVAVLTSNELPKLSITWDCGACEHNEKVPPLIEKEYSDYALAHGFTVSESETANMEIAKYHQRPPAARAMLGAFAGKDTLGVQVSFRDDKFTASDYNANAWFGMNDLCRSVAQKSAAHLSAKLHNK